MSHLETPDSQNVEELYGSDYVHAMIQYFKNIYGTDTEMYKSVLHMMESKAKLPNHLMEAKEANMLALRCCVYELEK